MSLAMAAAIDRLRLRVDAQEVEFAELRALVESFIEPKLDVRIPAFPAILLRMGYTRPNDDGSPSAEDGRSHT